MVFAAKVVSVLVASPSDTVDERDVIERALHSWNASRAENAGVVLLPLRWESSAVPVMGASGQEIINRQLLDRCDIVFAVFHSRLGQPTAAFLSGTVEEIEKSAAAGKPAHVYFSDADHPSDVDTKQLNALRKVRARMRSSGLLGSYRHVGELEVQVHRAIERDLPGLGDVNLAVGGGSAQLTAKFDHGGEQRKPRRLGRG